MLLWLIIYVSYVHFFIKYCLLRVIELDLMIWVTTIFDSIIVYFVKARKSQIVLTAVN